MKQVLQYFWIEKYGCIEKQGFNFTSRANIRFNYETSKLSIEKNDNYCENFFDDNIELSCIVGQNGVGKTTLLRMIKEIFSLDYGTTEYNCIAIFFDGSKYEGWYKLKNCDDIEYDVTLLTLYKLKGKKLSSNKEVIEYKKTDYLYYSEQLVQSQYGFHFGNDELSTSHLLFDIGFPYGEEVGDHVNRFFLKEFENQMNLIIDYGERLGQFKIKYPPFVKANFIIDQRIFEDFVDNYKELNLNQITNEIYHEMFPTIHLVNDNYDIFKDKMAEAIFLNIVYTLNYTNKGLTKNQFKALVDIMSQCCILSCGWESLKAFLDENQLKKHGIHISFLSEYVSFMNYIDNDLKPSNNGNAFSGCFFDSSFIIPTIKNNNSDQYDIVNDIKEFFKNYSSTAKFHSYINFSWGLSSGELSLLNIFSRLYSSECIKDRKNEAVVLLLDEIDVTLHPEWQRNMINELLKFIKYVFKDRFIQVIMTTHSPIMLSDIPKQNVLFLKNENGLKVVDGCDTFASNIFQLFREGFFIGDTGIGVFAEEKLKKIVERIHDKNDDDEEVSNLIDSVGDKFLRNKLKEEYLLTHSVSEENSIEKSQAKKIAELESNNNTLLKSQREQRKLCEESIMDLNKIQETLKKAQESQKNSESESKEENSEFQNVINVVEKMLSKLQNNMEENK